MSGLNFACSVTLKILCVCVQCFLFCFLCAMACLCVYMCCSCMCVCVMVMCGLSHLATIFFFTNTSYYSFTNPSSRLQLAFFTAFAQHGLCHEVWWAFAGSEPLQAVSLCRLWAFAGCDFGCSSSCSWNPLCGPYPGLISKAFKSAFAGWGATAGFFLGGAFFELALAGQNYKFLNNGYVCI